MALLTPPEDDFTGDALEQARRRLQGVPRPVAAGAGQAAQPAPLSLPQGGIGALPAAPTLTAPAAPAKSPKMQSDEARLANLTTGENAKSGVERIKSPYARIPLQILSGIGSAFVPSLAMNIPGTPLHHALQVQGARNAVAADEKGRTNEADVAQKTAEAARVPAQAALESAQANEANARAEGLRHPEPKQPTNLLEWYRQAYPDRTPADYAKFEQDNKPAAEKGGTVHELADGSLIMAHTDGTATAIMENGHPAKGKPTAEKEPNEYADFKADYVKTHANAAAQEIQREFTKNRQAPERPKTELVEIPDAKGGFTTREVGAGANLPQGTRTIGGVSSEATKEAETEQASKKARDDAQKEYSLAQQLAAHPSPTNDVALVMRYIGATKPDSLGKLRLNQNEMNLVLGTRSAFGDVEAFANKVVNGQKLTPKQRQDMLDSMRLLTGANNDQNQQAKEIKSKAEYDALPSGAVFMEDGKRYRKP